jgi:hypothetical protein
MQSKEDNFVGNSEKLCDAITSFPYADFMTLGHEVGSQLCITESIEDWPEEEQLRYLRNNGSFPL